MLRRADALAVIALSVVLILLALFRQEFIGDGLRHLPGALSLDRPAIGAPRWLLFPALAWVLIHPFATFGVITGVEPAVRIILGLSVASGIAYLWGLRVWLRADRHDAQTRAAALMMAGATMPFLTLYSDIAEVQIAAAIAVCALAICRGRFATDRAGDGTILATVGAITAATLVYQAVVLTLAFLPLVAPLARLRRRKLLLTVGAIACCAPAMMIAGRLAAGDDLNVAVLTTFIGERGELVRSSLVKPTPAKWAVALVAGPPQAIIGLWKFQGLPSLASGALAGHADAIANVVRLGAGLMVVAGLAFATVRTRDWRVAAGALAVVALPMIRNQQYTYVKFYVIWPVVVALASVKWRPRYLMATALLILALNMSLLVRQVGEGRDRYSAVQSAYKTATPDDCFFTSDWGAPFWHRWPGSNAALISLFWAGDEHAVSEERVTAALRDCFCGSKRVWTDTTVDGMSEVARLTEHFGYATLPVGAFLFRPEDGSAVASLPARIFVYSETRKAELCTIARR